MLKFITFSVFFLILCEICFCSSSEYSTEIISDPHTTSTTTTNPIQRSRKRSEYGEPCNKTLRCKSQSWLSCDYEEGRCQCAKPEEMVYDEDRKKCVALIGERCKYEAFVEEGIGGVFEVTECSEGAVCGVDGVCVCPPYTYEDGEGYRCLNKKDLGSQCSIHAECNNFKFLACINSTCQCFVPEDMVYEAGICKLKAGRHCNPYNPFALSTMKNNADTANLQRHINSSIPECFGGSTCDLNICSCSTNQYLNYEQGVCQMLKEKGESCIVASECNSDKMLTCLENKCQCDPNIAIENPTDYYYENSNIPRGVCVGKVDTSCNSSSAYYYNQYHYNVDDMYFRHCIKDAQCVQGSCVCREGLAPTKAKLCGLAYNQQCSINQPCSDKFTCTSINIQNSQYSQYTHFLCTCPNPEYQDESGMCQSHIGFPCDPTVSSACVKGAECIRQGGRNICKCKKELVKSIDGQKCEIMHGGNCGSNIEALCDQKAELQCRIVVNNFGEMNQICACKNLEDFYEPTRRICSKTVGVSCRKDGECVTNAFCSFDNTELSQGRVCRCIEGFTSSSESHTCAPAPYFLPSMKNATNDLSPSQRTTTDGLSSADEKMEDISATTSTTSSSDELQ